MRLKLSLRRVARRRAASHPSRVRAIASPGRSGSHSSASDTIPSVRDLEAGLDRAVALAKALEAISA